ncbi:MAG: type II secretion system protein [Aureliella sp.]
MNKQTTTTGSVHRTTASASRRLAGFTLIELLVAISILGIMAGMALYSLAGAQTDARNARTRGTVSKLNEIILQRWEEYRYRAVDVKVPDAWKIPVRDANRGGNVTTLPYSPREKARVRMVMLRDMMRMEMPDRITDLLTEPSQYLMVPNQPNMGPAALLRPIPPGWGVVYEALRSRVNANPAAFPGVLPASTGGSLAGSTTMPGFIGPGGAAAWHRSVSSAELLYLIVATTNFNGASALEYFRPSEVADTDSDGLLEFVDAWQSPIEWVRWPAGYDSDLVRYANPDPMDPLQTDWRFRKEAGNYTIEEEWRPKMLVPLIVSRGQDGQLGIITNFNDSSGNPLSYATMTWPASTAGKPFGPRGPYFYPDPHFTWDFGQQAPNTTNSEIPYSADNPDGFRRNQLGCVPNYMDSARAVQNTFAEDNITNHDIILEP